MNPIKTLTLFALTAGLLAAQTQNVVKAAAAAPPAAIPTFSTEDLSRTGIFYAGGKYVGEPGKEVMGGSAYVEVWVPKQIRHPYPIIYLHGAGWWVQRPDSALPPPESRTTKMLELD